MLEDGPEMPKDIMFSRLRQISKVKDIILAEMCCCCKAVNCEKRAGAGGIQLLGRLNQQRE